MKNARDFFTEAEIGRVRQAIKEAELETSGELRIHIENDCHNEEALDRATEIFAELKMHKTEERNGVLFYLAVKDHRFAILGDAGINIKVPDNFWDDIKEEMIRYFRKQEFTDGLIKGITMAGTQLREHFPYRRDDVNELPDEITFG